MYNLDYECTYHLPDVFLETDQVNDSEKDFIRSCIYRQDLLNIFYMEDFDEIVINQTIYEIYDQIRFNKELNDCIEKISRDFTNSNNELGVLALFSYDYLCYSHACICDFLKDGYINEKKMCELKKIIFQ